MANYSFKNIVATDGQEFENSNFTQVLPHSTPFGSAINLVFRNCNLLNCDIPSGSTVVGGLHAHLSFCSHLNPDWVNMGLQTCPVECEHMIEKTEIKIDGVVIDTIYEYEGKAVD